MSVLERIKAFWRDGISMGGQRDLYSVFGYKDRLDYKDFIAKYKRQDIAKRIIDKPVNALWSDPPTLSGDDTFVKAWDALLEQVPVFHFIQRLDKLAGLGRFAILVLGFSKGALDTPAQASADNKLLYLQPYGEASVTISEWDTDQNSPRFGLPKTYRVDPGKFDTTGLANSVLPQSSTSFDVHWTRALHVAEGALETPVYGSSRLESCFNILDDLLKVSGGSAETYWLAGNRGLHVDVDKEMELDPEDEKALSEEFTEYQNELRRIIRTRGVKVSELGGAVADPKGPFSIIMALLAANTGIPQRILMGAEAGQLASQQDRASWAQTCEERINEYGQPVVFLPFLQRLISAGVLPEPKGLSIVWPDSFKMNPLERAQTSAQMARSAANLSKALQTVQAINEANARAAQPQIQQPAFGGGGGGFMNNADPKGLVNTKPDKPSAKGTVTPGQPKPIELPPLLPEQPIIELLSVEECRQIIGFGKHPPVFDNKAANDKAVSSTGNND